jgi:hypothetical protein
MNLWHRRTLTPFPGATGRVAVTDLRDEHTLAIDRDLDTRRNREPHSISWELARERLQRGVDPPGAGADPAPGAVGEP